MARLTAQEEKVVPQDEKMDDEEKKAVPPATANRWAALRGYISSTMEQNPAFAGKD